jgi:predicted nucleic acid-binding protein
MRGGRKAALIIGVSLIFTMVDYRERAEECRRLAKLAPRAEDWGHFLEMAQTWELLAKKRKSDNQIADAFALAKAIANGREQKKRAA